MLVVYLRLVVPFTCAYAANLWAVTAAPAANKATSADDNHQQDEQYKNSTNMIAMAKS